MSEIALPTSRPLMAALWMMGALISFSVMAVSGRELAAELDTFEIMTYRSLIGLVIVVAVIAATGGAYSQLISRRPGLHLLRNVVHFAGQNCWFYAVAVIPLAQLTALEFTNPIWVALLAPLLLGERVTAERILAVGLGFVGVLLVARPGVGTFEWGHAAGLAAALGFALNTIFTKNLSRTDSTLCILFWMTLSQSVMGFVCAAPGGITLFSVGMIPWVLLVAITGLTAHYSLASALAYAPASVVAPMEFARLPLLAVVGMIMYGEPLEMIVFVGGAVILAGNLVNLNRERKQRSVL